MMKQLTIVGAMEYPERYEDMIELLARRDLSPMITHRFRLDAFLDALAVAQDPSAGAKVMVEMVRTLQQLVSEVSAHACSSLSPGAFFVRKLGDIRADRSSA